MATRTHSSNDLLRTQPGAFWSVGAAVLFILLSGCGNTVSSGGHHLINRRGEATSLVRKRIYSSCTTSGTFRSPPNGTSISNFSPQMSRVVVQIDRGILRAEFTTSYELPSVEPGQTADWAIFFAPDASDVGRSSKQVSLEIKSSSSGYTTYLETWNSQKKLTDPSVSPTGFTATVPLTLIPQLRIPFYWSADEVDVLATVPEAGETGQACPDRSTSYAAAGASSPWVYVGESGQSIISDGGAVPTQSSATNVVGASTGTSSETGNKPARVWIFSAQQLGPAKIGQSFATVRSEFQAAGLGPLVAAGQQDGTCTMYGASDFAEQLYINHGRFVRFDVMFDTGDPPYFSTSEGVSTADDQGELESEIESLYPGGVASGSSNPIASTKNPQYAVGPADKSLTFVFALAGGLGYVEGGNLQGC